LCKTIDWQALNYHQITIDREILRIFQELEFEIDEVRFDEVEGAFEIKRQSLVDLHDKQDFQIATLQFFKEE
jgi:hypothetical protein